MKLSELKDEQWTIDKLMDKFNFPPEVIERLRMFCDGKSNPDSVFKNLKYKKNPFLDLVDKDGK